MADGITSSSSSGSKHLMWMTAGLFVGMGVMMAGGLFMAGRVIRSVGLTAAMNGQDKIRTPGGDFRVEKDSDMGPRLLVYPRVSLELPGTSDAAESLKEAQSGIKVVTYHSNDPQVFVDDWYKSHLMQDFTRYEAADKPQIEALKLPELADASVVFVSERGNKLGIVALTMDEDGTQIALVRVNKSGNAAGKTHTSGTPDPAAAPASGSAEPAAEPAGAAENPSSPASTPRF